MNKISSSIESKNRSFGFTRRREFFTLLIFIGVFVVSLLLSKNFADISYILQATSRYMEFGIIALAMTLIIIAGQIDLSVAGCMACVATFTALMFHAGLPMELAIVLGLASGFGLGLFNGVLVAYAGLPPLIVTIGTMALFRGISQIFIGDHSLSQFPSWFNSIDKLPLLKFGNVLIPVTLLFFIVLAVGFYFVLHRTGLGRKIYSLGTNRTAAEYSGVNSKKVLVLLFGFSSFFAGMAGIMMMSRLLVVRFDMASGGELDVVTMVLLGGADINGGKGSILGTFIAVFIIIILKTGLMVASVSSQNQMFIMGAILLLSIIIPNIGRIIRERSELGLLKR
ncbi:MAG: ABC transporter permease [Eubacteriales bacterium]